MCGMHVTILLSHICVYNIPSTGSLLNGYRRHMEKHPTTDYSFVSGYSTNSQLARVQGWVQPQHETQGNREALGTRNLVTDWVPHLSDSIDGSVTPHVITLELTCITQQLPRERTESPWHPLWVTSQRKSESDNRSGWWSLWADGLQPSRQGV